MLQPMESDVARSGIVECPPDGLNRAGVEWGARRRAGTARELAGDRGLHDR